MPFFIFVVLNAAALKLQSVPVVFDYFLHQLRKYAFYDEPLYAVADDVDDADAADDNCGVEWW